MDLEIWHSHGYPGEQILVFVVVPAIFPISIHVELIPSTVSDLSIHLSRKGMQLSPNQVKIHTDTFSFSTVHKNVKAETIRR